MRAAFYDFKTRQFSIDDVPRPGLPPDQVLLKVETVGICGSDLHLWKYGIYGGEKSTGPEILGHEFSGIIEEIGPEVRDPRLKVGNRVAVDPTLSCGECEFCLAGRENICPHQVFLGLPPTTGALREFITLPPHNLFPVPKGVDADGAMLCEPLAVAVHAAEIGGIKGGEKVAVIGCGCLGLQICKLLDLAGAEVVLAVEPVKERRELAPSFGARKAVSPDEDPIAVCREANHGRLPDIVYEVAGPADALGLAQELVRPGGTLVYAGIHAGAMEIDFVQSRRKELVWKWVRRSLNGYPAAIDLIARKVIDPAVMVTHHWPLEKIADAHDVALAYGDGIVKGAIDLK